MFMNNKGKIIQKWTPIFESMGLPDTKVRELFCLFAEDYSIRANQGLVDSDKLPEVIDGLLKTLEKVEKREVKRTLYNPITGKIEYELDNGIVIDEKNKFKQEPSIKQLIYLFGVDFVREVDKQGFREERLNEIING